MKRTHTLLLAMLSGCAAPAYVAGLRPAADQVSWAQHEETRLSAKDGTALFYQSWRPAKPKAAVLVVHGLKDHSDRYVGFAKALTEAGYAVHAFDLRGHGDSTGDRVWVEQFDDYLDDVEVALSEVKKLDGNVPVFLFGHSMGGAIVASYAVLRQPKPTGIVLSAAALKATEPYVVQAFVKLLGRSFPTLALFKLDDDKFSRDAEVVAAMKNDPLVYDKAAPAHTAGEVIKAIDRIRERMKELDVPVLAMHGTADAVTPPEGSRELIDAAKTSNKKLAEYDGLYHDLLHEPERDKVIADVIEWLNAH